VSSRPSGDREPGVDLILELRPAAGRANTDLPDGIEVVQDSAFVIAQDRPDEDLSLEPGPGSEPDADVDVSRPRSEILLCQDGHTQRAPPPDVTGDPAGSNLPLIAQRVPCHAKPGRVSRPIAEASRSRLEIAARSRGGRPGAVAGGSPRQEDGCARGTVSRRPGR
jgi:hypothetical protein